MINNSKCIIFLSILKIICSQKEGIQNEVLFEGDIAGFTQSDIDIMHGRHKNLHTSAYKNMVKSLKNKWPKGIVPYQVTSQTYEHDMKFLALIQEAFDEIHKKTCVRFYPKTDKDDSNMNIEITGNTDDKSCHAAIGKMPGRDTTVTLNGCFQIEVVLHEILHALGKDSMKEI